MVVDPAPTPLTEGCARGPVVPAGITTVRGDTAATDGSELASVTETVEAAGLPNVTGKLTELPVVTVTFVGNRMPPAGGPVTTMVALALASPGELAVIVADPADKPVTGTGRLVAPVEKVAVPGTVATAGLLELRDTVNPDAAAVERLRVRFCVALPLIVRVAGDRFIAWDVLPPVTCTCVLAPAYPAADAVTVTVPALYAVSATEPRAGVVIPSGMKTTCGEIPATDGLVLDSVISTPPDGAAAPSATGKFTEEPAATDRFPGKRIAADVGCVTVTPAVALPMPGALAVIVTAPAATAVSATGALPAPAGMMMLAGTVATFGLLEFRLTVIGEDAAEDRLSVRF
jgi:hypothetical protein